MRPSGVVPCRCVSGDYGDRPSTGRLRRLRPVESPTSHLRQLVQNGDPSKVATLPPQCRWTR